MNESSPAVDPSLSPYSLCRFGRRIKNPSLKVVVEGLRRKKQLYHINQNLKWQPQLTLPEKKLRRKKEMG